MPGALSDSDPRTWLWKLEIRPGMRHLPVVGHYCRWYWRVAMLELVRTVLREKRGATGTLLLALTFVLQCFLLFPAEACQLHKNCSLPSTTLIISTVETPGQKKAQV